MKISYLIYGMLVAGWVITDAPIHNRSRWWALGIFILPFLAPYYFIKTRTSNNYWKLIGIWIVGFMVFQITESIISKSPIQQPNGTPSIAANKPNLEEIRDAPLKKQGTLP